MLLAIDIGNTNITMGIFDGADIVAKFRITTKISRTSDEFGSQISDLIRCKGFSVEDITEVIIASVVPKIMYSFSNGIYKYLHKDAVIVGVGTRTGIRIETTNPKEIGPDRIVDAVGAYELYGGPVLVVDFGTATTYDLITGDGRFVGGIISPGIRISANALTNDTANLPEIEIKKPDNILGKDTVSSMQAGLMYGTIGQTEYIVRKMIEESGLADVKVVATGGLGKSIAKETDAIQIYDEDLTLKGLQCIFAKQKG